MFCRALHSRPVAVIFLLGGITLPEKSWCVIPQSSERHGFRHHNEVMNKEGFPSDLSDWADSSHRFSALVFHYREPKRTENPQAGQLANAIALAKSISNNLPEHQCDFPWFPSALCLTRGTSHDSVCTIMTLATGPTNGTVSAATGPSDASTNGMQCRQHKRLKSLVSHVHASLFRTPHANRRHCCLFDKQKKKRASSIHDGAYP